VLAVGVKFLKKALIASGVGAIVVLLGSLVEVLTRSKKFMDFFKRASSAAGGALKNLVTRIENEGIGAFQGLGRSMADAAKGAYNAEAALQALREEQEAFAFATLRYNAEVEKSNEIASDRTKSEKERLAAARRAFTIEQGINKTRVAQIEKEIKLNKAKSVEDKDLFTELQQLTLDGHRLNRGIAATEASIRKDASKARRRAIDELESLREKYQDLVDTVNKRIEQEDLQNLTGEERVQKEFEIASAQIDALELVAKERAKEARVEFDLQEEFAQLRLNAELEFQQNLSAVQIEAIQKRMNDREAANDAALEIEEDTFEREVDFIKKKQEIDALNAETSISNEDEKQKAILDIQIQAYEKQRALAAERYGEDSLEVQLIDAQLAQMAAAYEKADLSVFESIKKKILDGLNITEEQAAFLADSFKQVFDNIFDGINAATEAQIEQQETVLDLLDEQINETQSKLSEERRAEEKGQANDVLLLEKTLKEQNAERKRAEEERNALEEKAARQRRFQQGLETVSNYVLAASKLVSAEAKNGLFGILTAVAGLAILASFVGKAKATANSAKQFKGGGDVSDSFFGEVAGPSHERGGKTINVEGREFVVRGEHAQEHKPLLADVNAGKYKGVDMAAVMASVSSPGGYRSPSYESQAYASAQATQREIIRIREERSAADQKDLIRGAISEALIPIQDKLDSWPKKFPTHTEWKQGGVIRRAKVLKPGIVPQ
jgi:hypothetical protein